MRISDLRRRVSVQSRSATKDNWGQQINAWVDQLVNCPACIEPISGGERLMAGQLSAEVSFRITVRYSSVFSVPTDIDSWRVVYGMRVFNIHAVLNQDERNRWVEILCSEGLNDGR